MDINPKQIRCAYWMMHDLEVQGFVVEQFCTTGSGTQLSNELIYFWLLIIFVKYDMTKKVFIDEDGVPFVINEFN
jgi:hypothetical protein